MYNEMCNPSVASFFLPWHNSYAVLCNLWNTEQHAFLSAKQGDVLQGFTNHHQIFRTLEFKIWIILNARSRIFVLVFGSIALLEYRSRLGRESFPRGYCILFFVWALLVATLLFPTSFLPCSILFFPVFDLPWRSLCLFPSVGAKTHVEPACPKQPPFLGRKETHTHTQFP